MDPSGLAGARRTGSTSTTSPRTYTNGAPIGTTKVIIKTHRRAILKARPLGLGERQEVDPGGIKSRSPELPRAAASRLNSSTATTAFGARGPCEAKFNQARLLARLISVDMPTLLT